MRIRPLLLAFVATTAMSASAQSALSVANGLSGRNTWLADSLQRSLLTMANAYLEKVKHVEVRTRKGGRKIMSAGKVDGQRIERRITIGRDGGMVDRFNLYEQGRNRPWLTFIIANDRLLFAQWLLRNRSGEPVMTERTFVNGKFYLRTDLDAGGAVIAARSEALMP